MGKNTQRVRVELIIDVDADAWAMGYGVTTPRELTRDVKQYVRDMIDQGPAGFEFMELAD